MAGQGQPHCRPVGRRRLCCGWATLLQPPWEPKLSTVSTSPLTQVYPQGQVVESVAPPGHMSAKGKWQAWPRPKPHSHSSPQSRIPQTLTSHRDPQSLTSHMLTPPTSELSKSPVGPVPPTPPGIPRGPCSTAHPKIVGPKRSCHGPGLTYRCSWK